MINHLRKDFLAQILKNTLTQKKIEFSETRYYFRGWRNPKGVFVLEKGAAKLSKSGAFGKIRF
jgi:predicted lipid carrier protein YhbT